MISYQRAGHFVCFFDLPVRFQEVRQCGAKLNAFGLLFERFIKSTQPV